MIPNDFIDELLARTDIVEVVGERVNLKKQGQNYQGLCPFHNEKSPSFSVSQDKQFYYCFGCQASGNALKFLMEFDRVDFVGAVERLAGRLGIEVPRTESTPESAERTSHRKSMYDVLEQSAGFFKEQLRTHSTRQRAIDYLKSRGLSGEIARDFGLGYAPPGWDNLLKAVARTNHERELLIDSGMVIDNEEEGKTYDRFRDRVIFPIRDIRGRVIAFGGRVIGDGKPKYLNSPETEVFHKGRELYGLHEARRRNRKLTQLMVVEGYMDVVALAQHGIDFAVATLGTATTEDHLERMYRLVSRLVFSFDGDEAGRNAGWKALLAALPLMRDGRSARFLFLPDGEDPDTLVRKEGKDKLELRIERAQHLPDFFFEKLSREVEVETIDGKAALAKTAMPLIQEIPEGVFKQLMIDRLSSITGLGVERLVSAYQHSAPPPRPVPPANAPLTATPASAPRSRTSSELVKSGVGILLQAPETAHQFDESIYEKLFDVPEFGLFSSVVRTITREQITAPAVLLAAFQGADEFDLLCRLAEQEQLLHPEDLPAEFAGIVHTLLHRIEAKSKQALRQELLAKPFGELSQAEKD
ncbi:MAG: DNA primase, partial [Pseudomonadales bacterium]|nr:DNA primase [Pseudomonadales bacterium]